MDMNELMKQAQAMQKNMMDAQAKLAEKEVTGESGAGMVKIVMNGRHDVKNVTIDPDVLKEDKELLEDLLAAAVNDAVRKVEENNRSSLSDLAGGMKMPEGFKMPF